MTMCAMQDSGAIELYFYGELEPGERARVAAHVRECADCAEALVQLEVIRTALASRPDVSTPPTGDWSGFMQRLDERITPGRSVLAFPRPVAAASRRPLAGLLAAAALVALVALSVLLASRAGRSAAGPSPDAGPAPVVSVRNESDGMPLQAGLTSVSQRHLERSKLVVLGLATREPERGGHADWAYERDLATALLNDTRLYRIAAEERGLTSLAGVMKDLELVLLQASMAEAADISALPQIQRLIHKRGLVQKMDVVGTTGLLP